MRRLIALIALMSLVAAAYGQTFPEPRTVKINERVYVLLGPIQHPNRLNQGYMINSTVIVGDKGVMLVDSGGSDEVGRHIAAAVRRITEKPVSHVVNTHHHGDHYLGNVAFEGATFISSEMCRRMVLETGAEWLGIMERDTRRHEKRRRSFHGVRVVLWVPRGSQLLFGRQARVSKRSERKPDPQVARPFELGQAGAVRCHRKKRQPSLSGGRGRQL